MPDKNDPKTLGTIVYTWDKEKRRKIRDCSLEEWINMPIGCAPPGLLAELGLEAKRTEEKPAFRIKPCSEPIKSLLKSGDVESQEIGAGANSWIPYATITIKGRYLVPCDLGQVPQLKGSPAIEVSPGAYRVDVKVVQSRLGRWGAVAAVRIISPESTEYDTNKKFDVAVDLAAIAIYDRQAFFKRIPLEERDFFCSDLIDVQEKLFIAITGKTEILIIPSGDGDGSYPVYQLESNGNKVGMEIRFMGEDH